MKLFAQYWGDKAAGILAVAQNTGRILVALRSEQVYEPGTWGTIGGKLEEDDSFEDAALREFQEETGYSGPIELISTYKFVDEDVFEYQNFIGLVPHEIENLSSNWETAEFAWITLDELKSLSPKHPGLEMLVENSIGLLEELMQSPQMELPFEHLKAAINLLAQYNQTLFFHGSYESLPVGTMLIPQESYEEEWGGTDFYGALEKHRPKDTLAHKDAVFMVDNIEDIDNVGSATEWIFTVKPLGPVQRHDMNWSTAISVLLSEEFSVDSFEIAQAAKNYWLGIPHPDESVWEYLTPKAEIIAVEKY